MDIASLLKALGDDTRLRLVHLLSKGSFNVQELTNSLSLSQSTISHHLKILEQAGLVTFRKEGSWSFYTLAEASTDSFEGQLLSLTTEAVTRSASLVSQLESDSRLAEKIFASRRDKARQYFDTVAREWSHIRDEAQGKADYLPELKQCIPYEGTLLELGCGSGMLLKQLLPRAGDTIGVDYSDAMIQEARSNLQPFLTGILSSTSNSEQQQARGTVDLRLGYLEHLPIGDETVDCALACMVFHHIADPLKALKDIYRAVRPGGTLVIADLVEHNNELMRERFADLWLGFSVTTFSSWISQTGFYTPEIRVLGPEQDVFLLTTVKK